MQKQNLDGTKTKMIYRRKTKASPATNLLEVTNVLHPVVSKCLRGWPGYPSTHKVKKETQEFNFNQSDKEGLFFLLGSFNAVTTAQNKTEKNLQPYATRNTNFTPEYVFKSPLITMKVFGNQILARSCLSHFLKVIKVTSNF